jgi:hypothetical protein
MIGPCLCGDTHCPSCGPAQGNWRCPLCNAWADDCCEHIDAETGKIKPEFEAEVEALLKAEAEAEAQMVEEYFEDERLAEEWEKEHPDEF